MIKRILSSITLVVILVPLLVIGGLPFTILVTVASVLALYELLKVHENRKELPFLLKVIAYLLTICFCMFNSESIEFYNQLDYKVVALFIFIFLLPMVFINNTEKYNLSDALFLIGSVLLIGFSFNLVIVIRNYDIQYFIYLVLISTITDSFALITGKLIGEHKLCPKISPKKTVEGLIGGVFMGTFVATAYYHTVISSSPSLAIVIGFTMMLCCVGQIGDLVFSSIKRYYEVKDFSNLIPGHGGVLDRFDSLIFVLLAFMFVFGIL